MARALWNGAVAFGLVSIPVEVHTAVREAGPTFRFLRKRDKSRIRFQKVAEKDHQPVEWKDLVKGFEYAKGRFVTLTKEDFETAAIEKTRTIEILDFVDASQIDDRFFRKPYYLTPGRGGETAYALLREAIRESGRIGIAKFVMRDKQHLAAVEAIGDALVLTTMRFAEELVDISELKLPKATGRRKQDLAIAKMLVEKLSADWEPEKYTDDYHQNLMKVIEAKRKGEEVDLEVAQDPRHAEVVDLIDRLRRSLALGSKTTGAKRAGARAAARAGSKPTGRRKGTKRAA